jgi:hypothetical protein
LGIICGALTVVSKEKLSKMFFWAGIIMLLFASGKTFQIFYHYLPLLSFVRINGEYRVFSILCFCIMSGYSINNLLSGKTHTINSFKTILKYLQVACAVIIAIAFIISVSCFYYFRVWQERFTINHWLISAEHQIFS